MRGGCHGHAGAKGANETSESRLHCHCNLLCEWLQDGRLSGRKGDLDSTGSVTLWLRAQLLSAGKTLGKITTANTELALAA